jgi:hypothetical protein
MDPASTDETERSKRLVELNMLQELSERSRLRLNEEASINSISNFTRRRKW